MIKCKPWTEEAILGLRGGTLVRSVEEADIPEKLMRLLTKEIAQAVDDAVIAEGLNIENLENIERSAVTK